MESIEEGWDNLYRELWKACAGSIVDLPEAGNSVVYFPQGHLEQLEGSTSLELDNVLSRWNLPSKIHCCVIHIQLRVEEDDEVFAQIALLPQADQENTFLPEKITGDHLQLADHPESRRRPHIPEPKFYSFSKVLSASDINAHCRLHVLKQHAEKCLPPLDMSQQTPSQELKAKDLRGNEWTFKHVSGGQPRRHLFTTGWSNFVNTKGLVAGDSFVLLRGENEKLGVGIRRLARPCLSKSSQWVPSESVDGVLATVSQAVATKSLFTVFYRPRRSQFIVGLDKYLEADNRGFSAGMRYSMLFKGEDLTRRKLIGTVTGVNDVDSGWQNSAWRSLKVHWDNSTSIPRPERVSPWEIEPLVTSIPSGLIPSAESKNIPRSRVVKRRKTKPELHKKCMEHLGAMTTTELSLPPVPSLENAGKRLADAPHVLVPETYDFDKDAGLQELNNEGYNSTTSDVSKLKRSHPLVPMSASSANGITQPNFLGPSNQILIDDLDERGRVEGPYVSEIAQFVPNSSPSSDKVDSWIMTLLSDSPEQFEGQSEASPFGEHLPKDPCMPFQQTSSTELPCSPRVIHISSIPSQIPFTGPGNGNELINWEGYRVARRCIPILDRVIMRYPSTLASFRAVSDTPRSMFLGILAEVVHMLEQLKVENKDNGHLDLARSYLIDLNTIGIDVSWLERRLNHINGIWKKNILFQRREELVMQVDEASAKVRRFEEDLSSLDMELVELASSIDVDPLSSDQSVIQVMRVYTGAFKTAFSFLEVQLCISSTIIWSL